MNTGAILNRINFGMAVGANRLPGAAIASFPGIDTLRGATRATQVDAVVAVLLAGDVSPDTRAVLMNGENPLAGVAAANALDGQDQQVMMAETMTGEFQPPADRGAGPLRRNVQPGSLGTVQQLSGVAQIVGLALGSPEFQRR